MPDIVWIPSQSPFMALKGSRITFKMLNRRDLPQLTAEVLSRDPMRHIKSPSTASAAAGPPPHHPSCRSKAITGEMYWQVPTSAGWSSGPEVGQRHVSAWSTFVPPGLPSNLVAVGRMSHWLSTQRRGEVMAAGTRVPGRL